MNVRDETTKGAGEGWEEEGGGRASPNKYEGEKGAGSAFPLIAISRRGGVA